MSGESTPHEGALVPLADLEKMAGYIAASGLFGVKKKEEAIALMLLAQAEGQHPATIAQEYDIIQGRAARKTHSIVARFQRSGGTIKWIELSDTCAKATFTHPAGGSVTIDWTMERAKKTMVWNVKKDAFEALADRPAYKNYGRALLRSRCCSEGIRAVFPAATGGMLSEYEAEDADDMATIHGNTVPMPTERVVEPAAAAGSVKPTVSDAEIISETAKPPASTPQPAAAAGSAKPTIQDCMRLLDDAGEHPDHAMPTILELRKHLSAEDVSKLDDLIDALGGTKPPAPVAKPLIESQKRILRARLRANGKDVADLEKHMGSKLDEIPFDAWEKAQAFASAA